jgi:hemoglobin/transferrin/lactoferrin receptor protein
MRTVFAFFLVLIISSATAQTLTVVDKETAKPLGMVTITSDNPRFLVTTNSGGQASISALRGATLIEIRIIGYTTQYYSYDELEGLDFLVPMPTSFFSIDQVVVSASKWSQIAREIPLKITPIAKSQIDFYNPQTAADLLAISGDVFVQKSQQGGGSPMIRGFATNRLLIAVDGVRMNNAIFRGGNLQNVISIDPFAVDRAEVLFGPGSVIYGSDAIGGVMSFYTLAPKHSSTDSMDFGGTASARYSTANGEKTGHVDINYGWEKWAFVTSFSYTNFNDLRMGSFGPNEYLRPEYVVRQGNVDMVLPNPNPEVQLTTGYSQTNVMQKVSFKSSARWSFDYGFHYSATSNYDRYDRLIHYRNGSPRSAQWYYGPQIWSMNNFRVRSIASSAVYDQLTLQLAHQYFQESRNDRDFNATTLTSRKEKVNALSLNADFKKIINANQKLFYGAEAIGNLVNSSGVDRDINTGAESQGSSRYPYAQWLSLATYLTYQHKLTETLDLDAGIRYSHFYIDAQFDDTFYPLPFDKAKVKNGAATGSLGLTCNPTENWRFKGVLSTGFRAPNVDDIGKIFDSEPGAVVVPNHNLKAEYAYNAEVGLTRKFNDIFEVDLLTFYTLLSNAMVRRNATLNGQDSIVYDGVLSQVQAIQNAAFAKVWGFQTDFELMLPRGFMLTSRFSYQKGTEELDDGTTSPLRHAAPWFGVSRLSYRYKKFRVSLYAHYSGEVAYKNLADEERGKPYIYAQDENGNPYSPAWYTLNLGAHYRLSKSISFNVELENITDRRYRPYSSGLVAAGINLVGAVRVSF